MKVGVNGAVRDISDLKVGVNGAVRAVSEAYIGVSGAVKKVWPLISVGYQEILDTVGSGTWVCPASGQWEVEGHGGGCGGYRGSSVAGRGGGGSGDISTITITAGKAISYEVGQGGTGASNQFVTPGAGTDSRFGDITFSGSASVNAAGSLATNGQPPTSFNGGEGGKGNKNKPEQTYGNGGNGGRSATTGGYTSGGAGKDGALILTYLG